MKTSSWLAALLLAFAGGAGAENHSVVSSMSTLITTPFVIEGLANDDQNLYAPGRAPTAGDPCPVWKVPLGIVKSRLVRAREKLAQEFSRIPV